MASGHTKEEMKTELEIQAAIDIITEAAAFIEDQNNLLDLADEEFDKLLDENVRSNMLAVKDYLLWVLGKEPTSGLLVDEFLAGFPVLLKLVKISQELDGKPKL